MKERINLFLEIFIINKNSDFNYIYNNSNKNKKDKDMSILKKLEYPPKFFALYNSKKIFIKL